MQSIAELTTRLVEEIHIVWDEIRTMRDEIFTRVTAVEQLVGGTI